MNNTVRCGKLSANRMTTATTPPDAPAWPRDLMAGDFGQGPHHAGDNNRDQIKRQILAAAITVLHLAAQEKQAQHVEGDVLQVVWIMEKAVGEQLVCMPGLSKPIGVQAKKFL